MKNDIVALIPVREGSERVKSKNFRCFYQEKSLTDIKIQQVKQSGVFDKIYLSSDSGRVKELAIKHEVDFIQRDEKMCQSHIPWSSVVNHIMDTIPGDPIVTWALTTAPLFANFRGAVDSYLSHLDEHDSVVGVLAKKTFYLNSKGRGLNFNPGKWHPYSQDLDTMYEVTGSVYIAQKSDMKNWQYWFGTRPYLFHVNNLESIDVDTPDDFDFAKKLYEVLNENPAS